MPNEYPRGPAYRAWRAFLRGLPPTQAMIMHMLTPRRVRDVSVESIYARLHIDNPSPRRKQQIIGSPIAKLNVKLAAHKRIIKPGEKRRTYRLYTTE